MQRLSALTDDDNSIEKSISLNKKNLHILRSRFQSISYPNEKKYISMDIKVDPTNSAEQFPKFKKPQHDQNN